MGDGSEVAQDGNDSAFRPMALVAGDPAPSGPAEPPAVCPECGADRVVPVIYGYPTPDMREAARAGEIILGHCVVRAGYPAWECASCHTIGRLQ